MHDSLILREWHAYFWEFSSSCKLRTKWKQHNKKKKKIVLSLATMEANKVENCNNRTGKNLIAETTDIKNATILELAN